jgi:hypothetical protein
LADIESFLFREKGEIIMASNGSIKKISLVFEANT